MKYRRSLEIRFLHNLVCPEFPLSDTPFISSLDAEEEYLTIYNPSHEALSLDGYSLTDSKKLHRFTFPEGTEIASLSQLHVYTCPGGSHHKTDFIQPCVLWTNFNGTLRRKEVLNNEHCTMQLHAPNGKCLATCTGGNDGPPRIQRRSEELHHLPPWQLDIDQRTSCAGARLVVLAGMMTAALVWPSAFGPLYWMAVALDIISRSRVDEVEESWALRLLDQLGDRVALVALYLPALLAASQHCQDIAGIVVYILLFAAAAVEMVAWSLEGFHKRKESPNHELHDVYHAIRQYFSGTDSADFHQYGDLLVSCICIASEAALVMLFYRYKLDVTVPGLEGAWTFDLFHQIAVVLACGALTVRQANNLARIAEKLELDSREVVEEA